jgi:hypothetical protein
MVFVIVATIAGRNLADRPDSLALSLGVMWGATGFMYLATGLITALFLKR